jgi:hypothetical protein
MKQYKNKYKQYKTLYIQVHILSITKTPTQFSKHLHNTHFKVMLLYCRDTLEKQHSNKVAEIQTSSWLNTQEFRFPGSLLYSSLNNNLRDVFV